MSRSIDPNLTEVFGGLFEFLERRSFVPSRARTDWLFEAEEVVCIVNVQRLFAFTQTRRYGINLAVWMRIIGEPPTKLREHVCHIRCRAESLWKENSSYLKKVVLDLDDISLKNEERNLVIRELADKWIFDFLHKTKSRKDVCESRKLGYFNDKFIHKAIGELCGSGAVSVSN